MSEFTPEEDATIDAYVTYYHTIEAYLDAEKVMKAAQKHAIELSRKTDCKSIDEFAALMREAVTRGEFPPDHVVARNMDRALDVAYSIADPNRMPGFGFGF